MKRIRYFALVFLFIFLAGCYLPQTQESPGSESTRAAQTVEAELTRVALTQQLPPPPTPQQASPTTAVIPTTSIPTSIPSPTTAPTTVPCNMANFITDVTIPDGTVMSPGAVFVKTWRLRNAGSCTWTSGYQLVFQQGDTMGVPAGYAQSLTSGTVPPGGTADVSVTLTAPMTSGTYKGYWRLREPGGQFFALSSGNSFWVQIVVSTATAHTVTLEAVAGETGAARSDGHTITDPAQYLVGDSSTNLGIQLFISWNIAGIPAGATITEVRIDFTSFSVLSGNPFATLGCLDIFRQDYGVLDAGDYYAGALSGAYFEWCNTTDLSTVYTDNDFKNLIQTRLGTSRIQARLQFIGLATDGDGVADVLKFTGLKLIVTYTTP